MECTKIAYRKTILVLNASYEPINQTSWKRARILVLKDKAHVISSRTIRLKNYVKLPVAKIAAGKPSRSLILKRDSHTCQYCEYKGPNLTLDHVLPKSRGGQDDWQNLVTSCLDCNNCKDNRTPEEWADALRPYFEGKVRSSSALPRTWDSYQRGMLESRILSRGTTLSVKPRAPFNKMSISISTSEVDEWRDYVYV